MAHRPRHNGRPGGSRPSVGVLMNTVRRTRPSSGEALPTFHLPFNIDFDDVGVNALEPELINGTPTIDTVNKIEGAGSGLFQRAGADWVRYPVTPSFMDIGDQVTIEFWIRKATNGTNQYFISHYANISTDQRSQLSDHRSDNTMRWLLAENPTTNHIFSGAFNPTIGDWTSIALVKDFDDVHIFAGPTRIASGTLPGGMVVQTSIDPFFIAESDGSVNYLDGNMDDLKWTPDVAKWTGPTRTVPTP